MVKKTLLSLAIAATAAGLAGCKTGGDYKVDTGAVTAGSDGEHSIADYSDFFCRKLPITTEYRSGFCFSFGN